MMQKRIVILGGGINGLTCALLLQQSGYTTRLITAKEWKPVADDPGFTSLYPASSIKPVTVKSPILNELLRDSQKYFTGLLKEPDTGIRQHIHFEIHEHPEAVPGYAREMINFNLFDNGSLEWVPRRTTDKPVSGWHYDVLFADTPVYMPWLRSAYLSAGGIIVTKKLAGHDLSGLPERVIVNCTGTGTIDLFENDTDDVRYVKGHQIIIDLVEIPEKLRFPDFSYNYTAGCDIYQNPGGEASDVYFYPRSDCWILGASRQECRFGPEGRLIEEQPVHPEKMIGNTGVPEPMFEINRDILLHSIGLDIAGIDLKARFGYRFIRKEKGLRLESAPHGDKMIIHNYGHGGAGVTLSWGCAIKVRELVSTAISAVQ
ncbi:MAG: FAD-dependent oxidoreductase [Cyclonatronaceae bacterium]